MKKERDEHLNQKEEEDVWIIPSEMGYKDRKMAKWQGFILSDHAELMRKNERERKKEILPKEKQSLETISSLLKQAYMRKIKVFIQMDFIENGLYLEDIAGYIAGSAASSVYIQTADDFVAADLHCIRHVKLDDALKWSHVDLNS